jgi:hypothetical protein
MDLIDEPRTGFHVGLQIVKACLGRSGDVSRVHLLPFLHGVSACLQFARHFVVAVLLLETLNKRHHAVMPFFIVISMNGHD